MLSGPVSDSFGRLHKLLGLLSCLALSKCKYHPCPFHGTELRVFVVSVQANVFSFLSRTYLAPLVYSFSGGGQSCATIQQSGCHCGHKNTSLRSTGEAALRSYFAGGAYWKVWTVQLRVVQAYISLDSWSATQVVTMWMALTFHLFFFRATSFSFFFSSGILPDGHFRLTLT